jgi:hypothetical protein
MSASSRRGISPRGAGVEGCGQKNGVEYDGYKLAAIRVDSARGLVRRGYGFLDKDGPRD